MKAVTPPKVAGDRKKKEKLWSLQPIQNPAIPAVRGKHWPRNDIDWFVLARMEAQNVRLVDDAGAELQLRRL